MKKNLTLLLVLLLAFSLFITGCTDKAKEEVKENDGEKVVEEVVEDNEEEVELLISAAASLTDVLNEVKEIYEEDNNVVLNYSFGSSGALQAQIEEGAPVDIFFSAAEKQMNALEEQDLLLDQTRQSLLINNVVLIKPSDSDLEIESFEDLANEKIEKIAIGDPSNVPVGQYSEEIFENLDLKGKIEDKLILATDVRTVLAWVASGEVDCGIVYATDAYTTEDVEIITTAPEGSHKLVSYPVAVIKDSKNAQASEDFINFLQTDSIKEIFKSYGFELN